MAWSDLAQCRDCHGEGGWRDVTCVDGGGPWDECAYCWGTGKTTRRMNAWIMHWSYDRDFFPDEDRVQEHLAVMAKAAEEYASFTRDALIQVP